MKKYLPLFVHSPLFSGIEPEEILAILGCLGGRLAHYDKGNYLLRAGEPLSWVGMVLQGSVRIIKEDFWGSRSILSSAAPGDLFGEAIACAQAGVPEISVMAVEATDVLCLDFHRLLHSCSSACAFHSRLIRNLLKILADRNLQLTGKLGHLSRRTTREKLLSYLSACAQAQGGASFTVDYNRQELADYLFVDRSALSAELSRLRADGVLTYEKNRFTLLLSPPQLES